MKQINWIDHLLNVVAVIVGVSLAFFVSDRSEEAKRSREAEQIIASIIDDLDTDVEAYDDYQIPNNEQVLFAIKQVINIIQSEENIDSLGYYFEVSIDINNYFPSNVTYNSMVSSGKMDLISDFEVRKKLSSYQMYSDEAAEMGKLQVSFLMDEIIPMMMYDDAVSSSSNMKDWVKVGKVLQVYASIVNSKLKQYELVNRTAISLRSELEALNQ